MEQERDQARDRAGNLSVELAAMTQNRDELRQALDRAERDLDEAERKVDEFHERMWRAENSLTIRRSLCRDIAVELGCEGLEGDESLKAGLAMIRALKQARDVAYHRLRKASLR
jgi:chromosome segregation ATPase